MWVKNSYSDSHMVSPAIVGGTQNAIYTAISYTYLLPMIVDWRLIKKS